MTRRELWKTLVGGAAGTAIVSAKLEPVMVQGVSLQPPRTPARVVSSPGNEDLSTAEGVLRHLSYSFQRAMEGDCGASERLRQEWNAIQVVRVTTCLSDNDIVRACNQDARLRNIESSALIPLLPEQDNHARRAIWATCVMPATISIAEYIVQHCNQYNCPPMIVSANLPRPLEGLGVLCNKFLVNGSLQMRALLTYQPKDLSMVVHFDTLYGVLVNGPAMKPLNQFSRKPLIKATRT